MLSSIMKFDGEKQKQTHLAMRTGGLDWSSHTKIFPSLFPGKKKIQEVTIEVLHNIVHRGTTLVYYTQDAE